MERFVFTFTQSVTLEKLSVLDLALSGMKRKTFVGQSV